MLLKNPVLTKELLPRIDLILGSNERSLKYQDDLTKRYGLKTFSIIQTFFSLLLRELQSLDDVEIVIPVDGVNDVVLTYRGYDLTITEPRIMGSTKTVNLCGLKPRFTIEVTEDLQRGYREFDSRIHKSIDYVKNMNYVYAILINNDAAYQKGIRMPIGLCDTIHLYPTDDSIVSVIEENFPNRKETLRATYRDLWEIPTEDIRQSYQKCLTRHGYKFHYFDEDVDGIRIRYELLNDNGMVVTKTDSSHRVISRVVYDMR